MQQSITEPEGIFMELDGAKISGRIARFGVTRGRWEFSRGYSTASEPIWVLPRAELKEAATTVQVAADVHR